MGDVIDNIRFRRRTARQRARLRARFARRRPWEMDSALGPGRHSIDELPARHSRRR